MKNIFCVIIIFINISFGFSQTKEIILIVDTIEQANKYLIEDYRPSVNFGFIVPNFPNEIIKSEFNLNQHPNFISIKFQIQDTSTIYLPISNKGDFIEIKGLQKIQNDTLRINRIPFIESNLPDTTFIIKTWSLIVDTSLIPLPDKTEKLIEISKIKTLKTIAKTFGIIVNGERYICQLSISQGQGIITHGYGTKPKNLYKKSGKHKKNAKRFDINSETKHWIYKTTINL